MSAHLGDHVTQVETAVSALDAAADIAIFRFGCAPAKILRWGVVVSVDAIDNTAALVIALDHTTHSDAGAVTRTNAVGGATLLGAGTDPIGTTLYVEPVTEIIVNSGDFLTMEVTSAATAGDGFAFIEYQELAIGSESGTTVLTAHAVDSTNAT